MSEWSEVPVPRPGPPAPGAVPVPGPPPVQRFSAPVAEPDLAEPDIVEAGVAEADAVENDVAVDDPAPDFVPDEDAVIDRLPERLQELDEIPIAEHPARYEALHTELSEALTVLDRAARTDVPTPQPPRR